MTETNFELVFEKDYELLQEIKYSAAGGVFKDAKKVVLKAPTMKNLEKFNIAAESGSAPLIKFICDHNLILGPDGSPIQLGDMECLHALAAIKLADSYIKFFFDTPSIKIENQNKI